MQKNQRFYLFLRCHAVLCDQVHEAKTIEMLLNSRLKQTFLEYKREKKRMERSRLCKAKNGLLPAKRADSKKQARSSRRVTRDYKPPVQHGMSSAPRLDDVLEEEEEDEEEEEEEEDDDEDGAYYGGEYNMSSDQQKKQQQQQQTSKGKKTPTPTQLDEETFIILSDNDDDDGDDDDDDDEEHECGENHDGEEIYEELQETAQRVGQQEETAAAQSDISKILKLDVSELIGRLETTTTTTTTIQDLNDKQDKLGSCNASSSDSTTSSSSSSKSLSLPTSVAASPLPSTKLDQVVSKTLSNGHHYVDEPAVSSDSDNNQFGEVVSYEFLSDLSNMSNKPASTSPKRVAFNRTALSRSFTALSFRFKRHSHTRHSTSTNSTNVSETTTITKTSDTRSIASTATNRSTEATACREPTSSQPSSASDRLESVTISYQSPHNCKPQNQLRKSFILPSATTTTTKAALPPVIQDSRIIYL